MSMTNIEELLEENQKYRHSTRYDENNRRIDKWCLKVNRDSYLSIKVNKKETC